jgi:hypothetical protein
MHISAWSHCCPNWRASPFVRACNDKKLTHDLHAPRDRNLLRFPDGLQTANSSGLVLSRDNHRHRVLCFARGNDWRKRARFEGSRASSESESFVSVSDHRVRRMSPAAESAEPRRWPCLPVVRSGAYQTLHTKQPAAPPVKGHSRERRAMPDSRRALTGVRRLDSRLAHSPPGTRGGTAYSPHS